MNLSVQKEGEGGILCKCTSLLPILNQVNRLKFLICIYKQSSEKQCRYRLAAFSEVTN